MSTYKARQKALKSSTQKFLATSALTAAGLVSMGITANAQNVAPDALPQGAEVTRGSATYDYSQPNTLTIEQHAALTSAEYKGGFNIGQNAAVLMLQDSGDIFVHIDKSDNTSFIEGIFSGSGSNFVLNKNGVIVTGTARIDMNSFVASTAASLDLDKLEDGQAIFTDFGDGEIVIEEGAQVTVAEAGLAAFVSPFVSNAGVINAKMGTVAIGAGETVTLDLYGDGLVELAVDGELEDALIENTGTISAEGGKVQISARAAKDAVDNIINVDGIVTASSASVQGGKIVLSGGNKGTVSVKGTVDASGEGAGDIDVTGENITIADTAELKADGGENGDGGNIKVIASDKAIFRGSAYARGGAVSGKGGFVETSGHGYIDVAGGFVNTLAADGTAGTWLIDPTDITIVFDNPANPSPFTVAGATSIIGWAQIGAALVTSDVVIATTSGGPSTGNITFDDPTLTGGGVSVGPTRQGSTLEFIADNNIIVDDDITISNVGTTTLNAGGSVIFNQDFTTFDATSLDPTVSGNLVVNADDDIFVNTGSRVGVDGAGFGDVTLSAMNNDGGLSAIEIDGTVQTLGGKVTLNADDYFVEVNATGAVETNDGDLEVNSNHGFDIDNGGVVDLGSGDAHINTPLVQLGDDIVTTGAITGTATTVDIENDDASVQDGIDVAGDGVGAVVNVYPGLYQETALNRTLPWSGGVYDMGLYIGKSDITLRGVDGGGNVITDASSTLATIEALDHTNFGAIHGISGDGVTIEGLSFAPEDGYRNKTIEVWGDAFTLRNSVVDNNFNLSGYEGTAYEGYGAGTVYIGDERYDAVNGISHIESFLLEGNIFINGSVTVTNGVGVSGDPANRVITGNQFIGNGAFDTRDEAIYNSGILLTGRQSVIPWRPNPIGAVNITGNTFEDLSINILARGEMDDMDWNQFFFDNTFDQSAAAFEDADTVRDEGYEVSFGGNTETSTWRAIYDHIQWAVDGADNGDRVNVGAGTYNEKLLINKSVHLRGVNRHSTFIDTSGLTGYGLQVTADDVTLDRFTLQDDGTSTYGIKATGDDLDLRVLLVRGFGRSEVDLNGVDGATLTSVIADGQNTAGVGIALSNVNDVTMTNVRTRNNDWGGIGLYDTASGATTNVTLDAASSAQLMEDNPIYIDAENGFGVSGLELPGFDFAVRNPSHRDGLDDRGEDFIYFQRTEQDAFDFAVALDGAGTTIGSSVEGVGADADSHVIYTNEFFVGEDAFGTSMFINPAIEEADAGATINVRAGTYEGTVNVDKSLNLYGAQMGNDARNGRVGADESVVLGDIVVASNVDGLTVDGFTIENQGDAASGEKASLYLGDNVSNVNVFNNIFDGQNTTDGRSGVVTSSTGVEDVLIRNNLFTDARYGIYVNRNANNVDIVSNKFDANRHGVVIQDGGFDTHIRGNAFLNNTGSGVYVWSANGFVSTIGTLNNNRFRDNGQHIFYLDGNAPDLLVDGSNGNTFYSNGGFKTTDDMTEAELFALEDLITHKMDDVGNGLVVFRDGELFVTQNTGGIQHAINIADAGDTVNVDGTEYQEDLTIDKELKLTGHGTTLKSDGADSLITVTASNVNIDPFAFVGDGVTTLYGISVVGGDNFISDGNSFVGFVEAAIDLTSSKNVRIFGNTITGGKKGIHGDDVKNIQVFENNIYDTTVAGVHIENSAGSNYTNDVDLWENTVAVASGIGILIQNSAFATVGPHPTNPFASGFAGGNVVSGGDAGIVVEDSDNAYVAYNTVDSVTGNGITIDGGLNADVLTNRVGTTGGMDNIGGEGILVNSNNGALVQGNEVTETGSHAILVSGSNDSFIQTNDIDNAGGAGIRVEASNNVTVNMDNNVDGTRNAGIGLHAVTNSLVDGNTISNTGGSGIWMKDSDGTTVSGNEIDGTWQRAGAGTGSGIYVTSTVGGTVSGNTIDNVTRDGDGVHIDTSEGIQVTGNFIGTVGGNISDNGVEVQSSDDTVITDNEINDTGSNGIFVNDSDRVEIGGTLESLGNAITRAGAHGIHVTGGESALIQYNTVKGTNASSPSFLTFVAGDAGAQMDGVHVEDNDGVEILNNTVASGQGLEFTFFGTTFGASGGNGANGHGIFVSSSDNAVIDQNNVTGDLLGNGLGAGLDGIHVEASNLLTIGGLTPLVNGNKIFSTGNDGIHINGSFGAFVLNNIIGAPIISDIGDDGIDMNYTLGSLVAGNIITNTDDDGIAFSNGGLSAITINLINGAGDDGIDISDAGLLLVAANRIDGSDENGIQADSTFGMLLAGNIISDSGEDGINADDGLLTVIRGNEISESDDDGIEVDDSFGVDIINNRISVAGDDGIDVDDSAFADINRNRIGFVADDGIVVDDSFGVDILRNRIAFAGDEGIEVDDSAFADINRNRIRFVGDNGIQVDDSFAVDIKRNNIAFVGDNGIDVDDSAFADINRNRIAFVRDHGITVDDSFGVDILRNRIAFAGDNGIDVDDSAFADINRNRIRFVGDNGIEVDDSFAADINRNNIAFADDNGIEVDDSAFVDIRRNNVSFVGDDGIDVDDSFAADIINNRIRFAGDNGIDVDDSAFADINRNRVFFVGDNGIRVDDSFAVDIRRNLIGFAGDDGIDVDDSAFADINRNVVFLVGDHGIDVDDSFGVDIIRNGVFFAGRDGIHVEDSHFADIERNLVAFVGGDGIDVEDSWVTEILSNRVYFAADNGIEFQNGGLSLIDDNRVAFVGGDGIYVNPSFFVGITNNRIDFTGGDGIDVNDGAFFLIANNQIGANGGFIGDDGIDVNGTSVVFIVGNDIQNADESGIQLTETDLVNVLFNTVSDNGDHGLFARGGDNGSIVLSGNTFTDNPVGARFESGEIDLTGPANSFINTDPLGTPVGMQFDEVGTPGSLTIAGNTLGNTIFTGFGNPGSFYVRIEDGTLLDTVTGDPILINGLNANFDGFVPASVGGILTLDQLEFLEARLFDADDSPLNGRGQIFVGSTVELDVEEFFNQFGFYNAGFTSFNLTLLGLPPVFLSQVGLNNINTFAGGPDDLNNINPAAGGPDDLNNIAPAAGNSSSCWSDVVNASATGGVNFNFSGDPAAALEAAASCS